MEQISSTAPPLRRTRSRPVISQVKTPPKQRSRAESTASNHSANSSKTPLPRVPNFELAHMTPASRDLLQRQEVLLRRLNGSWDEGAASRSGTAMSSPGPAPFLAWRSRSRSRFTKSSKSDSVEERDFEVKKMTGMTEQSVKLLREQESVVTRTLGVQGRTVSLPNLLDDCNRGDAKEKKQWKRERWWKVWRLL